MKKHFLLFSEARSGGCMPTAHQSWYQEKKVELVAFADVNKETAEGVAHGVEGAVGGI